MKMRNSLTLILALALLAAFFAPATPVAATALCDAAQFVADVTVPDGAAFSPGQSFEKTWRIKNIGSCAWTTSYKLVFSSGEAMGAPTATDLTKKVNPGETIDLTLRMTAPASAGTYRGYWMLRNAAATNFGIGVTADKAFWAEIRVNLSAGLAYDFAANAASAQWTSGSGNLAFPGADGDNKGFVIRLDKPKFETGVVDSNPALLTAPENTLYGFIQGVYPEFTVQNGDRFQAIVNCEYGATNCFVNFQLQYQIGTATPQTLWSFYERYDGLYYRADINLSALAGKTVKFILRVGASGYATGDRALWGAPRIVRGSSGGPTPTPITPTVTPTPGVGTPTPNASCDRAQFIADVTIPDGSNVTPGTVFNKTWRIKNVGTCTWSTSYALVFLNGDKLGGPDASPMPKVVAPGQTVDVTVSLTAPASAGTYRGYWLFRNTSNQLFGIGASYNKPWWVDIRVVGGPTPTPTKTSTPATATATPQTPPPAGVVYDFAANAQNAGWYSALGALPFPGADGDSRGFAIKFDTIQLENGASETRQSLLTVPQNINNGYIVGIYPPVSIKTGDKFQATIGCQYGATTCYVSYRLDYQVDSGPITNLWAFSERYEGQVYNVNLDLSALNGKNVKFRLVVSAAGSATGDRAIWASPRILRPAGASTATATTAPTLIPATVTGTVSTPITPTSTFTATATPIPVTSVPATATPISSGNWSLYESPYGFRFKIPAPPTLTGSNPAELRFTLPIDTPGTNLSEKYIDLRIAENAQSCAVLGYDNPDPAQQQTITINGINFTKQAGIGAAAGSAYDWVSYSSMRGAHCVSLAFVLRSANPGNFATPPPLFNKTAEAAVFTAIMDTFQFVYGPYAVINVASNDVLNIRSGAGFGYQVTGTFPYNATNIQRTVNATIVGDSTWRQVFKADNSLGWVNSFYLTEYVTPQAFCADARVTRLISDFREALTTANGDKLASLVSPTHGLNIYYTPGGIVQSFAKIQAATVFTSATSYNWGYGPGGGEQITGAFKDVIQPKLLDVLTNTAYATYCETPQAGPTIWESAWRNPNLRYYSLYRPGTPGIDLDWRTWAVGIEYVEGNPYITTLMQFQWEP